MSRSVQFRMLLLLALASLSLHAQDPASSPPAAAAPQAEEPIHTLHVYMDLIQLPVLVLDSEHERMKPIDASYFRASLDSGPEFRPRHVRQEGDDPITLGILLDANTEPAAMAVIGKSLAGLVPSSLHPNDHVSLYVVDCGMVRVLRDVPANASVIQAAVDRGLQSWQERRKQKHPPPCEKHVGLWDALGFITLEIGHLPGRRVLLAVTDGIDSGSTAKWDELRVAAQGRGVAIFGYSSRKPSLASQIGVAGGSRGRMTLTQTADNQVDPFDSICQLSGGMMMHLDPSFVSKELERFTAMLRERYILEFTRPRNDVPGEHNIVVTIPKKSTSAYIRPAGVTILSSIAPQDDDTTIQRDTTDAPEIGNRRPVKPN